MPGSPVLTGNYALTGSEVPFDALAGDCGVSGSVAMRASGHNSKSCMAIAPAHLDASDFNGTEQ